MYNSENSILYTVESIISQPFEDFELIIVNDGSTDESVEILNKEFNDKRINIINIKNSGVSNARNIGIQNSRGKYIIFIDSDDRFKANSFETLISECENSDIDMVIFGFEIIYKSNNSCFQYHFENAEFDSLEDLGKSLSNLYAGNMLNQVWGKLFLAKTLKDNDIKFVDYKYGEDRLFIFDALMVCKKIKVIEPFLYEYCISGNPSLSNSFYDKKFEVCCIIDRKIRELSHTCGALSRNDVYTFDYMFIKNILSCITNLFDSSCKYNRKTRNKVIKYILNNEQVKDVVNRKTHGNVYVKIIKFVMKSRVICLNKFIAYMTLKVSKMNYSFFVKLKHNK